MKKLLSVGILLYVFLLEQTHMSFGGNSTSVCIEGERQALMKLKRSFEDPSNRLASWSGEDCCFWSGVSCDTRTGHVVQLDLRAEFNRVLPYSTGFIPNYLSARRISSSLAELTRLEYLDLSGNDFNYSRIPDFFGSFKYLTYLNISRARFGGKIAHQFENLTNLKVIDLGGCNVYVNEFQWASNLSSLKNLDMSGVFLRNALDLMPTLSKLPCLRRLQLNHCGIGNVHFSVGLINSTFLATIQSLGLMGNELGREIPKSLHNLTALEELDLGSQFGYSDGFELNFLQWVSSLSSLQHLDMSRSNFGEAYHLFLVLNTLPSLLQLCLPGCGIQTMHFNAIVNSTFFSRLEYLDLSQNWISGLVPKALKNMTELRELDLSLNRFNSTVPLSLVDSTNLISLNIENNDFDDIEGGLFSMLNNACSLKSLRLSQNPFGNLELGSTKNSSKCMSYSLESLYITNAASRSTIPDSFGELKSLKYLSLRHNLFSGPITSSIIELPLLRTLDLLNNQLTGEIPESFRKSSSLRSLDLSNNQFSGAIPQSFGRSMPFLQVLDLSNNQFSGAIPQSFGSDMPFLQVLDLSNNRLNGTVPLFLGQISTLKTLYLSDNQLNGPVFDSIKQLTSLYELDISSNPFEGVISELDFANLSKLKILSVSSTNFTWKVKSNWVPPFSLYILRMSSCRIGPEFPQWLQTQKDLFTIDFSNANISGSFPRWFHARYLVYLDLSMNQISGDSLSQVFEAAPEIETLLLGNNSISSSAINSLCKLEKLRVLDVSRNKLSGEIPDCLIELQNIFTIDLSFNRLSGEIPDSLGHLSRLRRFRVNENRLDGVIPLALRNCTDLELLDLGENKFSGSIPSWIGESLLSLRILRLRKNKLNDIIPSQLCKLGNLQILDLSENNLVGEIPRCFGNLTGMTIKYHTIENYQKGIMANYRYQTTLGSVQDNLDDEWKRIRVSESTKGLENLEFTKKQLQLLDLLDLSSNDLFGVIPRELCSLDGLQSLKLSHNHLSGKIPEMIGDLKLLETLDFSNNKLSGEIPTSLSALLYISHLNLSNNNLSGKIPSSNQLQTLNDASIYGGNFQLCGDPLPTKCPVKNNHSIQHQSHKDGEDDTNKEKIWFWFVVTAGYATGFWAVIGTFVFKREWRIAFFRSFDNIIEKMLVIIAVKVAILKKMMNKTSEE